MMLTTNDDVANNSLLSGHKNNNATDHNSGILTIAATKRLVPPPPVLARRSPRLGSLLAQLRRLVTKHNLRLIQVEPLKRSDEVYGHQLGAWRLVDELFALQLDVKQVATSSTTSSSSSSNRWTSDCRVNVLAAYFERNQEVVPCNDLVSDLNRGDYSSLNSHVGTLMAIHAFSGDKIDRCRGYMCLEALEKDVELLSHLPLLPTGAKEEEGSSSSSSNADRLLVNRSLVGHFVKRLAGRLGRLTYLVTPNQTSTSSALVGQGSRLGLGGGFLAQISLQRRRRASGDSSPPATNGQLLSLPFYPLVSVHCDEESGARLVVCRLLSHIVPPRRHVPHFTKVDQFQSMSIDAEFVLLLDPPLVLTTEAVDRLQSITGLTDSSLTNQHPDHFLRLLLARHNQEHLHDIAIRLQLPNLTQHSYHVRSNLRGYLIEQIPFTSSSQLSEIVAILRQQASSTALFDSILIHPLVKPVVKDDLLTFHFQVNVISIDRLVIDFPHPSRFGRNVQVTIDVGPFGISRVTSSGDNDSSPIPTHLVDLFRQSHTLPIGLSGLLSKHFNCPLLCQPRLLVCRQPSSHLAVTPSRSLPNQLARLKRLTSRTKASINIAGTSGCDGLLSGADRMPAATTTLNDVSQLSSSKEVVVGTHLPPPGLVVLPGVSIGGSTFDSPLNRPDQKIQFNKPPPPPRTNLAPTPPLPPTGLRLDDLLDDSPRRLPLPSSSSEPSFVATAAAAAFPKPPGAGSRYYEMAGNLKPTSESVHRLSSSSSSIGNSRSFSSPTPSLMMMTPASTAGSMLVSLLNNSEQEVVGSNFSAERPPPLSSPTKSTLTCSPSTTAASGLPRTTSRQAPQSLVRPANTYCTAPLPSVSMSTVIASIPGVSTLSAHYPSNSSSLALQQPSPFTTSSETSLLSPNRLEPVKRSAVGGKRRSRGAASNPSSSAPVSNKVGRLADHSFTPSSTAYTGNLPLHPSMSAKTSVYDFDTNFDDLPPPCKSTNSVVVNSCSSTSVTLPDATDRVIVLSSTGQVEQQPQQQQSTGLKVRIKAYPPLTGGTVDGKPDQTTKKKRRRRSIDGKPSSLHALEMITATTGGGGRKERKRRAMDDDRQQPTATPQQPVATTSLFDFDDQHQHAGLDDQPPIKKKKLKPGRPPGTSKSKLLSKQHTPSCEGGGGGASAYVKRKMAALVGQNLSQQQRKTPSDQSLASNNPLRVVGGEGKKKKLLIDAPSSGNEPGSDKTVINNNKSGSSNASSSSSSSTSLVDTSGGSNSSTGLIKGYKIPKKKFNASVGPPGLDLSADDIPSYSVDQPSSSDSPLGQSLPTNASSALSQQQRRNNNAMTVKSISAVVDKLRAKSTTTTTTTTPTPALFSTIPPAPSASSNLTTSTPLANFPNSGDDLHQSTSGQRSRLSSESSSFNVVNANSDRESVGDNIFEKFCPSQPSSNAATPNNNQPEISSSGCVLPPDSATTSYDDLTGGVESSCEALVKPVTDTPASPTDDATQFVDSSLSKKPSSKSTNRIIPVSPNIKNCSTPTTLINNSNIHSSTVSTSNHQIKNSSPLVTGNNTSNRYPPSSSSWSQPPNSSQDDPSRFVRPNMSSNHPRAGGGGPRGGSRGGGGYMHGGGMHRGGHHKAGYKNSQQANWQPPPTSAPPPPDFMLATPNESAGPPPWMLPPTGATNNHYPLHPPIHHRPPPPLYGRGPHPHQQRMMRPGPPSNNPNLPLVNPYNNGGGPPMRPQK